MPQQRQTSPHPGLPQLVLVCQSYILPLLCPILTPHGRKLDHTEGKKHIRKWKKVYGYSEDHWRLSASCFCLSINTWAHFRFLLLWPWCKQQPLCKGGGTAHPKKLASKRKVQKWRACFKTRSAKITTMTSSCNTQQPVLGPSVSVDYSLSNWRQEIHYLLRKVTAMKFEYLSTKYNLEVT